LTRIADMAYESRETKRPINDTILQILREIWAMINPWRTASPLSVINTIRLITP
jgi:hypothetical protein